jgi:hypothetical protein
MKKWSGLILVAVLVFGLVSVAAGAAFIGLGVSKHGFIKAAMAEEKITLGVNDSQLAKGEIVDTMKEAQVAGDIVRSHRHEIAPTYGDLLGGQRYDPTNTQQLTYAQAMNLENYLYLAVSSFGVTYLTMGVGAALVVIGLALMAVALFLRNWMKRALVPEAKPAAKEVAAGA